MCDDKEKLTLLESLGVFVALLLGITVFGFVVFRLMEGVM